MVQKQEYFLNSIYSRTQLHIIRWEPAEKEIVGVVQLVHGINEYAERYEEFARFLCSQGFAVVAHDHKGHGLSISEDEPRLYFGPKGSWWKIVEDIEVVRKDTVTSYGNRPYFIFGHSMGSFLLRSYLINHQADIDGCILCGTGCPCSISIILGKVVLDIESKKIGRRQYSPLVDRLIFGNYNKKFKPNRTSADWISSNISNVDEYLGDPLCGGEPTIGIISEMLDGALYTARNENIKNMDRKNPILLIAGEDDPVGNMGKGVKKIYKKFLKAGVENVEIKLYPGLRHEILNEHERHIVYKDINEWIYGVI